MDEAIVYRKTRRGATELAATHGALSPQARRVLILLNGERTLAELADLFGSESVEHIVADLEAQGFARPADPDEAAQTTQSIPTQAGDLRPALYEPPPARRGSGWIALGLFLASVAISGYWFVWRPSHVAQVAIAAARATDADRTAVLAASEEPSSLTQVDAQPAFRELPLSGLPAVTVTPAAKAAVARASAEAGAPEDTVAVVPASAAAIVPAGLEAELPAPGHRSAERQAPGTPAPIAATKTAAPLSEAASSPAPSAPPTARAVSAPVASAANARIEQTALDAPAAEATLPAPAAGGERQTLAAAGQAPVGAAIPTSTPAAAVTPAPANAPADQIAALAPPAHPQSAPVQLRARKHDPPEFPGRALRSRIFEGHVLARLYVTAEGKVEQVDIVKATPARVFDDEVKRALTEWTFDPPGRAVDTTVELNFKQ